MKLRIALTTRELMRLVALAAANLLLFQGVWMTLIYAPVAIVAMVLNLGLFCTVVRPRTLNRGVAAAMGGGLIVALAAATYLAESNLKPRMALALLDSLPPSLYDSLPVSGRSSSGAWLLDFALLDAMGIAAMLFCGWLAWPRRRARPGAEE
jgi:hypothetical protein